MGYNLEEFGEYLTKDNPKLEKEAEKLLKKSDKALKIAKGAGPAVASATFIYGTLDDKFGEDKTWGEAISHNTAGLSGTLAGIGLTAGAVAIGASPVGWAANAGAALGVGVSYGFEYLYEHNTFGINDKLDAAGEKIDEVGEAIGSGFDVINPFT